MSSEAQLVILNLPGPPRDTKMERESNCILFSIILKKYRIVQKKQYRGNNSYWYNSNC